jgi:hypothetical protein
MVLAPSGGLASVQSIAALPVRATRGHGARLPFVEYEAESATTDGTVIGPDRRYTSIAAEASGRRAVRLERRGEYVEFTLAHRSNAMTVRAAVPDSPDGRGAEAALDVLIDGVSDAQIGITSRYGRYYGRYPFSNDPAQGSPHHYFDETRVMFRRTLRAGTRVRLQVPDVGGVQWYVVDLADFELVRPPLAKPRRAISVVSMGADASGLRSSRTAFENAIATGRRRHRPVWIPPGHYRVEGHLLVDRVTVRGAGPWYSVVEGARLGFYGRSSPAASHRVRLEHFSIIGEVSERRDDEQVNGIGGAMNDSVIRDLFIQHEKAGLWFDGPMRNIRIERLRITDTAADGLNFHRGVRDAVVTDTFVRNTGDDGLAAWSADSADRNITFKNNTVIEPLLANGIAAYGGRTIRIQRNLVADTLTEGGGLHVGNRFHAVALAGTVHVNDNMVVRGGSTDPRWSFGVGALWFYALDWPIMAKIEVRRDRLVDSSVTATTFVGQSIATVSFNRLDIEGAPVAAIVLGSAGKASLSNSRATAVGEEPILRCAPGFVLRDTGGNSGFQTSVSHAAPKQFSLRQESEKQ